MKNKTHLLLLWLLAFTTLLCAQDAWAQNVSELVSGKTYYIKCGGNGSAASPFLYDDSGTLKAQAWNASSGAQQWVVTAVDGKTGFYTVKNVSTGRYMVAVSDEGTVATLSDESSEVYIGQNDNTGDTSNTWFNIKSSSTSTISYNWHTASKIAGWAANDGETSKLSNSEWGFWPSQADYMAANGFSTPTASASQLYRIVNYKNSTYAVAENSSRGVTTLDYTSTDNDGDFSQYWYLIDQGDGTTALKNALSGRYVQSLSGTKNAQYKMGNTAYGFTIAPNSKSYSYDIRDNASFGFNSTDKNTGATNLGGSASKGDVYSWTFFDGSSDANSLWNFQKVTLTDAQQTAFDSAVTAYEKGTKLLAILEGGKVRIRTARNASTNSGYFTNAAWYITDDGSAESTQTLISGDNENQQIWIVEEQSGGGYTFRNLATGKYLYFGSSSSSATTLYVRYYPKNGTDDYYVNISKNSDFSGDGKGSEGGAIHAMGDGHKIVQWTPTAGTGSNWTLESVDMTDDAVRAIFDNLDGHLSDIPTDGSYVKLYSVMYPSHALTDNGNNKLSHDDVRSKDAAQLWKLTAVSGTEGYYQVQNALTGQYISIVRTDDDTQCTSQSTEATSGDYTGLKVSSTDNRFESHFTIAMPTNTAKAIHCQSGGNMVIWATTAKASEWYFAASDMTDDEIAAQKTAYDNLNTEKTKIATYNEAYPKFFTDSYCTELAAEYKNLSDDELKTALNDAGVDSETLQAAAVKAKNSSWATWEKIFRVRDVQPYSNAGTWNNLLKIGNEYTSLSNPTGIWINPYEATYIYVGDDIPEGATLTLRSVGKTDSQGSQLATLTKGLNVVSTTTEGALYLIYTVETDTSSTSKKLADYANLPIHIEGGTVDGYFDATREGIDTDDNWKQMVSDGLFQKSFVMMKGRHLIYQLNGTLTKQYIPEKMREIVDFWDWMMDVFHEKMAINDYYDRWNNVNGFYSCTYNYMFATTYGTYYNESTLGEVLNYDNMAAGGGSLWGPAHENGHNHQSMINMIGCTEISNNLFSQIIVHLNGKTSTRLNGRKFADIAKLYAAGTSWHDYNLWDRNTLYLKLYLYYEVAGYKPDFCRELFRALRRDPLNHSTGSQANPTPASGDFLKFALKCCEVTGDDLSEFFEAYGFFVPFETRMIGDYANYWTENTQDMIDAALEKMHSYAKPKGNILFIENHIKHEPAIDHNGNYLYDSAGNQILRTDYSDEDAVGKCGDVGSYSDFTTGHYASGYTYSQTDNTITVTGEGAVGYKVYDSDGNLLYFANTNTFTLPESVVTALADKTMVLKVAQADGSDVTLPSADATTYELKVYHADALTADKSNTVYTDGTAATIPVLEGNALAFIQEQTTKATLPETLVQTTNVVDASTNTAYNVVLTDKTDFYSPSNFTAETLTYSRSNTAGWNSVCLPFAVSAADFGTSARLEQFSNVSTDDDGTATLTFTASTDENVAGQPCLVYCPDDVTEWNITKTHAAVVASPSPVSVSGASLQGSFTNETIGAGRYKLNSAGTAFGVTTDKGKVTAFRCYVLPTAESASAPKSFLVNHGDATTGICITNVATTPASAPVYDLYGRRVQTMQKGGVYVVNGKKIVR